MKNILIVLTILLTFSINAQTVISDTTVLVSNPPMFNRIQTVTYEDGRVITDNVSLDSVEVAEIFLIQFQNMARETAQKSIQAISRQRVFSRMKALDDATTSLLGFSVGDSISRKIFVDFIQGDSLEFDSLGTIQLVQIVPRAQGGYNLSMNGKKYRILLLDKSWVRVMQFPNPGNRLDLWLYRGVLESFDGEYRMGKANLINRPKPRLNTMEIDTTKEIKTTKKTKNTKTSKKTKKE